MDFLKPCMMRQCSDSIAFIQLHGLDSYKKQFNTEITDELNEADQYYKEHFGPKVTKQQICDYIRYWGVTHYITNCSPESTYSDIIADPEFCEAQITFYINPIDEISEFHKVSLDPYYRNIRDVNGVLVPEPIEYHDIEYDVDTKYIEQHGIVNYVLYTTCKIPLITLLSSRSVAYCQNKYIDSI